MSCVRIFVNNSSSLLRSNNSHIIHLCATYTNSTNGSLVFTSDGNFSVFCCPNVTLLSTNLPQIDSPPAVVNNLSRIESISIALFTLLVMIASLFGNTLVFLSFIKFYTLRSVTNYFILSLGAADILVSVLPMSFWVSYLFTGWPSRSHGLWYVWWMGVDVLAATASIMNLAFISIDRYICIKDPLRYSQRVTPLRAVLALVFIWCYGMVGGVLSLHDTTLNHWFEYFIFVWSYLLPVAIMIYCYIHIFAETRRHTKELRKLARLGAQGTGKEVKTVKVGSCSVFFSSLLCNLCGDRVELNQDDSNNRDNLSEISSNVPSDRHLTVEMDNVRYGLSGGWARRKSDEVAHSRPDGCTEDFLNSKCGNSAGWGGGWSNSRWKKSDKCKTYQSKPLYSDRGEHDDNDAKLKPATKIASKMKTKRFYSELKAARTLSLVMGTFLVCWTPFIISVLVAVWSPWFFSPRVTIFFKCLHYSNSGINPFLYSVLNKDFKKAYFKLLKKLIRKR